MDKPFSGVPQRDPKVERAARTGQATQDEKLLAASAPAPTSFTDTDPWRVLRITAEFVEGFDVLAKLGPAVTLFGSARTRPADPLYAAAVETVQLLAQEGLAIITGGPGMMEAGTRRA